MENHSCKTYFSIQLGFDAKKNADLLRVRRDCAPEEIGIFNKDEAEKFITEKLGVKPEWKRHRFIIGLNEEYNCEVSEMVRVTLKDLFGKEDIIRELKNKFSATAAIVIVPYISSQSEEPPQSLSLDKDIIEFLYKSDAGVDMDYYLI